MTSSTADRDESAASKRLSPTIGIGYAAYTEPSKPSAKLQVFCGARLTRRVAQSAQGENHIIKHIVQGDFEYQQELQRPLSALPNIRTVIDTIPDGELFVYRFLAGDLLRGAGGPRPGGQRRSILRGAAPLSNSPSCTTETSSTLVSVSCPELSPG